METAIEVIRWIGLVGAVCLTLVILKEVFLILRTLSNIRRLSERIHEASSGIAEHIAPGLRLAELKEPVGELASSSRTVTDGVRSLATKLEDTTSRLHPER